MRHLRELEDWTKDVMDITKEYELHIRTIGAKNDMPDEGKIELAQEIAGDLFKLLPEESDPIIVSTTIKKPYIKCRLRLTGLDIQDIDKIVLSTGTSSDSGGDAYWFFLYNVEGERSDVDMVWKKDRGISAFKIQFQSR